MSLEEVIAKNQGLSQESSILNVERHPKKTTEKYMATDDVALLRLLNERGWSLKTYTQIKARDVNERLFKPYMARFENPSFTSPAQDGQFQIIQRNAKDGTKSYEFLIGFFNPVYGNSFVVSGNLYEPIKLRHTGSLPGQIEGAVDQITSLAPKLFARIQEMKAATLTPEQQRKFAEAAIVFRCGEERKNAMNVEEVLTHRRNQENPDSIWNVLNTVHENVVSCPDGVTVTSAKAKVRKARALKGINVNVRVSRELWNLAEEYLLKVKV